MSKRFSPHIPHAFRLAFPLSAILAGGLLFSAAPALAHEGYRPSTVFFAPSRAGVFDGVAVDNSAGASAGDIYAVGEGRTIYKFSPDGTLLGEVEISEADGERMKQTVNAQRELRSTAQTPPPPGTCMSC